MMKTYTISFYSYNNIIRIYVYYTILNTNNLGMILYKPLTRLDCLNNFKQNLTEPLQRRVSLFVFVPILQQSIGVLYAAVQRPFDA